VFEQDAQLCRCAPAISPFAVHNAAASEERNLHFRVRPPVVMAYCPGRGTPSILLLLVGFLLIVAPRARTSAEVSAPHPSRWIGARLEDGRIRVTITDTGRTSRTVFEESDRHRREPVAITDLAFDVRRDAGYLATCCEPGSGQVQRVDLHAPSPTVTFADQGFAVDVAAATSVIARTDTFGTLAMRAAPKGRQEVREGIGASDVAVAASPEIRVLALIQSARLRAVVPTAPQHAPAILVLRLSNSGSWVEARYSVATDATYCRIVPLANGAIGLLAGHVDRDDPVNCAGDRLDVYDPGTQKLRVGALTFPGKVRHLSTDESSTFLIATTLEGAVRWQTLEGAAGLLAPNGFLAADW
jgi:hypothetical protein